MYDKIKECVWEGEPYYNTGEGLVFIFDGAEEGCFWLSSEDGVEPCSYVPLKHSLEFIQFVSFCLQKSKEWQESDKGIKRLREIALEELANKE